MTGNESGSEKKTKPQGFAILVVILLCCAITAIATSAWIGTPDQIDDIWSENPEYAEKALQLACGDESGTELERCQLEQEFFIQNQRIMQKDLAAQIGMERWTKWMFIISILTTVITLWALYYVRGTLLATRDALKDTENATIAMVAANDIALAAQRPWITINAKLDNYTRESPKAFTLDVEFCFENTGKMLAEDFSSSIQFVPANREGFSRLSEWFDKFERDEVVQESVLVPGQTSRSNFQVGQSIEHLPWQNSRGERKDCLLMLLVMARYRIPGEVGWRFAMRGFAVAEKIDNIDDCHFIYERVDDLTLEKLHIRPLGKSRAT